MFFALRFDCVAVHPNNMMIKYADHITIIGLVSSNSDSYSQSEVEHVVQWSEQNNLVLNTSKQMN